MGRIALPRRRPILRTITRQGIGSTKGSGLDVGNSANRPAPALHQARNDFGTIGYGGPCPPKGHGTHHYHFRLLAISRPSLAMAPSEVLRTAQPWVIQQAEFFGTYHC